MPVIAHNIASQFTNRQLNITTNKKTKSAEKLSSGYKINRSADDAAGLQISEKMRSQIRGLNQASRNIQDGISLCQVADGALNESHAILQRMRELSVQAANDTNSAEDRNAIQQEIEQLTKEVDRIANDTSFNKDIYPLKKGTSIDGSSNVPPTQSNYLLDSNYPGANVQTIDTNTISNYVSYIDSSGKTHYQLGNGTFQIIGLTNVVFDVSGKTCIENTNLTNVTIECSTGTELSIKNVTIDNHANKDRYGKGGTGIGEALKFQGSGNTLNVYGDNIFKGGMDNYEIYTDADGGVPYNIACSGINVGNGTELTINGTETSTLMAESGNTNYSISHNGIWAGTESSAIGSNFNEFGGTIIINSGNISASTTTSSSELCAAIGGGDGTQIQINGGKINVTGGGVGIGGGYTASNGDSLGMVSIQITGGKINGNLSSTTNACIGYNTYCLGTIDIIGGIVDVSSCGTSVIGGSEYTASGTINISGGVIKAINPAALGIGRTAIGSPIYGNVSGANLLIHSGGIVNITGGEIYAAVKENTNPASASVSSEAIGGRLNSYTSTGNPTQQGERTKVYVDGMLIDASGSSDGNGYKVYKYSNISNAGNNSGSGIIQTSSMLWIQMGAQAGQGMFLSTVDATAKGVGITDPTLDVTSYDNANTSISRLDNAINRVSGYRSHFGAQQNRLECAKAVDDNTAENTQYAESRIRDTDMAEQMVEYSKNNILEQVGQSMLAQANQSTQSILSLLS